LFSKQAPILVTKDNLPQIKQANNEFNYHGGLSEVELEMLKKMVSDNIEKTSEIDEVNNERNRTHEESCTQLHLQMTNNSTLIQNIRKLHQ
jgi:hypothetical protein